MQIDETMLNYKCKSHRGRSSTNKTDALCIAELVNRKITRLFATTIPNKEERTFVPIICKQVAANSVIWTDEHKPYKNLFKYIFFTDAVFHRYHFINPITEANTQGVKSFNNIIKQESKERKCVRTEERRGFLDEVCFEFKNKRDLLSKIL